MNLIKELYYGSIRPVDKTFKKHTEYAEKNKLQSDAYCKLADGITEEQKKVLDELVEALNGMSETAAAEAFVDGFRLGAELVLEVKEVPKDSVFTPIV